MRRLTRPRALLRHSAAPILFALLLATVGGCALRGMSNPLALLDAFQQGAHHSPICATSSAVTGSLSSQALATTGVPLGGAFNVTTRQVQACAYMTSAGAGASLMYPAVDAQGMVWSGKMVANTLVRLDPRTGAMREWTIPGGRGGVMDTVVDGQGMVWFTESAANFIGRFDPRTERFTRFPTPQVNHQNAEPERLQLDAHGALWFTAHQGMRHRAARSRDRGNPPLDRTKPGRRRWCGPPLQHRCHSG